MADGVTTFEDALSAIDEFAQVSSGVPIFRGHGDKTWSVKASLFRQDPDVAEFESEIIRELISLYPQEFVHDNSMFDRLVRMQHYGLPTRLLDVTRNALVALFFAVWDKKFDVEDGAVLIFSAKEDRCKFYDSDVVSCMANLANLKHDERNTLEATKASTIAELRNLQPTGRLIQFIKAEKPYFESRIKKIDLFRPVIVTAKRSNQRMAAQSGSFILYGLDVQGGPEYKRSIRVDKVIIDKSAKEDIRKRLESLGIEASNLFPEIDKAADRIIDIYKEKAVPF